jgi:hypothetical protein
LEIDRVLGVGRHDKLMRCSARFLISRMDSGRRGNTPSPAPCSRDR